MKRYLQLMGLILLMGSRGLTLAHAVEPVVIKKESKPIDSKAIETPLLKNAEMQILKIEKDLKKLKTSLGIQAVQEEQPPEEGVTINYASTFLKKVQDAIKTTLEGFASLSDFSVMVEFLIEAIEDPDARTAALELGRDLLVALAIGLASERLISRHSFLRAAYFRERTHQARTLSQFSWSLSVLGMALMPVAVFGITFHLTFHTLASDEVSQLVASFLLTGILWLRVVLRSMTIILRGMHGMAPLIALSKRPAMITYRFIRRLLVLELIDFVILRIADFIEIPELGFKAIIQTERFISFVLMIIFLIQIRPYFTGWLERYEKDHKKKDQIWLIRFFRHSWFWVTKVALITWSIRWITGTFNELGDLAYQGYITYIIFPAALLLSHFSRRIRILYLRRNLEPMNRQTAFRILRLGKSLDYAVKITFYLMAGYIVSNLWLDGSNQWLKTEWGHMVMERTIVVTFIVAMAIFLMQALDAVLKRYPKKRDDLDEFEQIQLNARIQTVLTVTRNAVRIAIWIPAILLIIGELGFDITPVLASLSVLALGFSLGLQSLVKDFVTGFFIIMENIMVVGDDVTIEGKSGTVESLSIRTIRIRDDFGTVHTIPFSAISTISNNSRDYTYAVVNVKFSMEEDLDKVKAILQRAYAQLKSTSGFTRKVLAPFEMRGVDDFDDHSMTLQMRIKTAPAQRSVVRREFFRILRQLLADEGIALPPHHYQEIHLMKE